MACLIGAAKMGAMHKSIFDPNHQYPQLLLSSSSTPSVECISVPASPISKSATKQLIKFPSTDFPRQHLADVAACHAAPIKALQSSSTSSTPSSASISTVDDDKAPPTLSEQWRDIQGENHWEGLLNHPINATLRAEIIRYGEFAQVCYDAFDFNQHSLYCGSCKYNRRVLFEKVDKGGCGYEVTRYLYATSKLDLPRFFKKSDRKEEERWSCDSNWIGYVAVCVDENEIRRIGRRDILIAWRGTVTATEWVDDLMTTQVPANIELARTRPPNVPFYNALSRIRNTNAKLAESRRISLAAVKPISASIHSPINSDIASIVTSQYPPATTNLKPATNVAIHSQPQDAAGGMNLQVSGASSTADYQLAPTAQASAAYMHKDGKAEKDVKYNATPDISNDRPATYMHKDGKAEKDVKYNVTPDISNDRPAAIYKEDLSEIVKVENGFLSLYSSSKPNSRFNKLSAGQQMAMEVKRLLQKYEGEEISISVTGHSLGAALAVLCAYDIAANAVPPPNAAVPQNSTAPGVAAVIKQAMPRPMLIDDAAPPLPPSIAAATPAKASNMAVPPEVAAKLGTCRSSTPLITVFSFAGPRVGNRAFKRRVEEVGVRVLRIVNVHDCVPKVPGVLFNENSKVWANASGYHHVGKELLIDFDLSPHLRHTRDLASHHNLEAHLHVLDGFHGFLHPFQSVLGRNPVLVNKSSDFLRKEAFIPPSWWQESNKGLVKDPLTSQWVLASREDDHVPEIHHLE